VSDPEIQIDSERTLRELDALAAFSDAQAPAVTRVVFSERDVEARAFLLPLFEDAGLSVRVDPIGNTFARWSGTDADLAAVGTGSHIDAIPDSGRYDGTVGVLGALEAIRALRRSGYRPRRSIEILMFTSEEPTRFGVGCTGSRLLSGAMTVDEIRALRDDAGADYDSVRRAAGFDGELEDVALAGGYYDAWVELHIEQGPILERERLPIGVVTAIAAPASLRVEITGEGGHAGAVLMPDRHDALCAAAEMVLAVESAAIDRKSDDAVATTGVLDVHPRAINSIPSRVEMLIDIRDTELASRDAAVDHVRDRVDEIAARRGVRVDVDLLNADPPALCGERIVSAIEAACDDLGAGYRRMISRAYHDSLFIARVAPAGMIFIPCRGGVSHRPDEYAKPEDIATGVDVLARTLRQLAG
jgi:N-carbamoyl-L-amino-acid hydrolase